LAAYVIFYLRSEHEYASVVSNSVTSTESNKLESIQQKFATLCYNNFFPDVYYRYTDALEYLKLHTLQKGMCHFGVLFPVKVYLGFKFCSSLLQSVSLQAPTQHLIGFLCSGFISSRNNCSSV
jgi:hypothetical protein